MAKSSRIMSNGDPDQERMEFIPPTNGNALTGYSTIIDRAVLGNASPEVIDKLMGLQERWEANQAKKAYDVAIAAFKADPDFPTILKTNPVSHGIGKTSYKYEDLATMCREIDPVLSKHGLSYRWHTEMLPDNWVMVTCIVSHQLGHSERSSLSAGPDTTGAKNAIQALGSTVTYLQRYTLKAALGLSASRDDDGRQAIDEPITAEQVKEIKKILGDHEFTRHGQPARVEDIRQSEFQSVVNALKKQKAAL